MFRLFLALLLSAVSGEHYSAPQTLATVRIPKLTENSGMAASRKYPGVYWSHNDSGGGPYLYAFDRTGKSLGRWRVVAARANDWEDIAIAPSTDGRGWQLYIGDIGDNNRRNKFVIVYRVAEPDPSDTSGVTGPAEPVRLVYPDGPHDAECLMVHPRTGDLYIVTKARGMDTETAVYRARAPFNTKRRTTMTRVAVLEMPGASALTLLVGRITGGDISPDGSRVVLCDYFHGWEAVLPSRASQFDAVWKADWQQIDLGLRRQGEAICYRADGKAVLAGSEGESFPLIEAVRGK